MRKFSNIQYAVFFAVIFISIIGVLIIGNWGNQIFPDSEDKEPFDKFNILKIYPTKNKNEWYVNMDDPKDDPFVKNYSDINLTKLSDGSWEISGEQVRFNVWSKPNEKWSDIEITGYLKLKDEKSWVEIYSRGSIHSSDSPCLGSAYKGKFLGDGTIEWVKEVTHPAYTERETDMLIPEETRHSQWVGVKVVMYNFIENGTTNVRLEMYEDKNASSPTGELLIKNNWELISVLDDRGEWSASQSSKFNDSCSPLSYDNMERYRQPDEILSMSGGNETNNIVTWRSDQEIWNFKYLSIREIVTPINDK